MSDILSQIEQERIRIRTTLGILGNLLILSNSTARLLAEALSNLQVTISDSRRALYEQQMVGAAEIYRSICTGQSTYLGMKILVVPNCPLTTPMVAVTREKEKADG